MEMVTNMTEPGFPSTARLIEAIARTVPDLNLTGAPDAAHLTFESDLVSVSLVETKPGYWAAEICHRRIFDLQLHIYELNDESVELLLSVLKAVVPPDEPF